MADFTTMYPESKVLDPGKRVNYIHGLVLGVDEFKQEECYLLEKDRLHNRTLHGYGTVCGLRVSQHDVDAGVEVRVAPGMAISPSGQVIQVPRTQCAVLEEWLAGQGEEIAGVLGSPAAGTLSLYLMLCYRECKTDLVPIPSGPCQSLEETSAPSRIADDFSLSFELQPPPDEHFEPGIQDFLDLMLSIPVEVGGTMTLDELKALVRTLIPEGSPSGSPPLAPLGSPASDAISPEDVQTFFRAAFLVWVTEVKPCLLTSMQECIPSDRYQQCVFLAELRLDVETIDGVVRLDPNVEVEIDEDSRQFLLSSQSLQEYLNPMTAWMKALENLAPGGVTSPPAEEQYVTLADDQNISGAKAFSAPIELRTGGRVFKNIVLPGYQAHHGRGAAKGLFSNRLPGLHFMTTGANAFGGEALFDIPIPNDMLINRGFQFRLVWGFEGEPEPGDIKFNWRVGALFFENNQSVSTSTFEFVNVTVSELSPRRNDVLVTDFHDFDDSITFNADSRYGVMRVSIEDPGSAIPQVYLLHAELQYVANRLGRSV